MMGVRKKAVQHSTNLIGFTRRQLQHVALQCSEELYSERLTFQCMHEIGKKQHDMTVPKVVTMHELEGNVEQKPR